MLVGGSHRKRKISQMGVGSAVSEFELSDAKTRITFLCERETVNLVATRITFLIEKSNSRDDEIYCFSLAQRKVILV